MADQDKPDTRANKPKPICIRCGRACYTVTRDRFSVPCWPTRTKPNTWMLDDDASFGSGRR